jgi:CRISPR-associated DxTHG motif protein
MKKIITFLGNRAREATYSYEGRTYVGQLFPEALRQFTEFDEMIVCATEDAARVAWPVLADLNDSRIRMLPIDVGETPSEMWATFDKIVACVERDDEVVFDITHGLRSLPFFVFLVAAYLKEARRARINAVYYGALELARNGGPAPVLDLSQFTQLLDWMSALDRLRATGDGKPLADLIRAARPSSEVLAKDTTLYPATNAMKRLEAAIREISDCLLATRTMELMRTAAELRNHINSCRHISIERMRPFLVICDDVLAEYEPFALANPQAVQNAGRSLVIQQTLVSWYIDRRYITQPATLLRELLVSFVLDSEKMPLDRRSDGENALNNLKTDLRGLDGSKPTSIRLHERPYSDALNRLWNQLTELRNTIAHPDGGERTLSSDRALKQLGEYRDKLSEIVTEMYQQ